MPTLVPYLNFDGKTEEAFNSYRSVFGGEFMGEGFMRFGGCRGAIKFPRTSRIALCTSRSQWATLSLWVRIRCRGTVKNSFRETIPRS
jgi:hypothetical protein